MGKVWLQRFVCHAKLHIRRMSHLLSDPRHQGFSSFSSKYICLKRERPGQRQETTWTAAGNNLDRGHVLGPARHHKWGTGDSRHTVSLQPSVGIRARFSDSGHPELSACGSIYAPTDAEGKPITFAVLGSRTHVSMALSGRRAGPMLLVSPSESSWVSGFGSV